MFRSWYPAQMRSRRSERRGMLPQSGFSKTSNDEKALYCRRDMLRFAATAGLASVVGGPLRKALGSIDQPLDPSPDYRDAVLAKGPVGYWRLGEAICPLAADETANGYDGAYFGNPIFGAPGAINDDPDTAVQFTGADYVAIGDSEDFSQPTSGSGLTVEVWLRPDVLTFPGETTDPHVHWLGKGLAGQREWGLRFYSQDSSRPNRISAYIWSPAGGEGAGAYFQDEIVAGEWIHVVACYEPGDQDTDPPAGVHIYKNGVHRLGPPSPGTLYRSFGIVPAHGNSPLCLATRDLHSFLIGALDEVAIYPRVLSADEILDNYLNGIGD